MDDLDHFVAQVRAGDRHAYRGVVEACEAGVRVVVAAILPDGDQVDDVVQEAFLTAFLKLDEYAPGSDLPAWIRTIARNLALNERRRWLREHRHRRGDHGLVEDAVAEVVDRLMPDGHEHEVLPALRTCVERLSGNARSVLERHYYESRSGPEIAREVGRPEGWVRLVLFRARQALVKCLEAKGVVTDGR